MREDLLALITNLSPTENQLMSGLGTSTAKQIRHEWLIDTLGAVKDNAQYEGASATYHTTTDPTRLYNYCQMAASICKDGMKQLAKCWKNRVSKYTNLVKIIWCGQSAGKIAW